ncbi:hypothetical protein BDN70DRAFT_995249 [Pholiota conissans]|uniref:HNH nuclease domain-containing protein n=1 Tax=Pholiota conissans TaxID=109636 RepID=A0A9P6CY89_9AGAR|nr:hypothetical protein BDN70DRAFT_995249 [Pholiota conissans]
MFGFLDIYLLHHVPLEEGLQNIILEIMSCTDDGGLLEIGIVLKFHPSATEMINDTLDDVQPQSHITAKKALAHDGYRCVVSKKFDANSLKLISELGDMMDSDPRNERTYTECSDKRRYAASAWARFVYKSLPEDLNGANIHRLENVMTLDASLHGDFDKLGFWFVQLTPSQGCHTFTTLDPEKLTVLSPEYLAIHAPCAKVAHLSGAAEYIDKFYRDVEDAISTFNVDGSSADVLETDLLKAHIVRHGISN